MVRRAHSPSVPCTACAPLSPQAKPPLLSVSGPFVCAVIRIVQMAVLPQVRRAKCVCSRGARH